MTNDEKDVCVEDINKVNASNEKCESSISCTNHESDSKYEDTGYISLYCNREAFYAYKRGRGHLQDGLPCEDYCGVSQPDENHILLYASDGVSDERCPFSKEGARFACESVHDVVLRILESDLAKKNALEQFTEMNFKKELVAEWRRKCAEHYDALPVDVKEDLSENAIASKYAATLLFVIVTESYYILGQIGDGAILLFNDENHGQIFKHTLGKYSSRTDNMASSFASSQLMFTHAVNRKHFSHILISTDGIYDKLDKGNTFHLYASSLSERHEDKNIFCKPFYFDLIDVNIDERTHDDCSVVLFRDNAIREECLNLYKSDLQRIGDSFDKVKFIRCLDNLRIYSAEKEDKKYEIHVFDIAPSCVSGELPSEQDSWEIRRCSESRDNIIIYPEAEKNIETFEFLFHIGATSEMKLPYGGYEPDEPVEDIYGAFYGITLFYNYIKLLNSLKNADLFPAPSFYETLRADPKGKIFFCAYALVSVTEISEIQKSNKLDCAFRDQFNLLGYFECGDRMLPLYRRFNSVKKYIHHYFESINMFRLVYSKSSKAYGVRNLSEDIWIKTCLGSDSIKIAKGEVLELKNGASFELANQNKSVGTIKYRFISLGDYIK